MVRSIISPKKIDGDDDPKEWDINDPILISELLELYQRDGYLDLSISFMVDRAMQSGITFREEEKLVRDKFGGDEEFEDYIAYAKWVGIWEELAKAWKWSRLFGEAICVFFMPNEHPTEWDGHYTLPSGKKPYYAEFPERPQCTAAKAYYPFVARNGYKVVKKADPFNAPEVFEILTLDENQDDTGETVETKVYYAHISRVVHFINPQKNLGMRGSSSAEPMVKIVKAKDQMLRSIINRAKSVIAGILAARVTGEDEVDAIDAELSDISFIKKIYVTGNDPIDEQIHLIIPELNMDQFEKLHLILQKAIAVTTHLSIRHFGEEDLPSGLGDGTSKYSSEIERQEMYNIQNHVRRQFETAFWLMGKDSTEFEWNEILDDLQFKENTQNATNPSGSPEGSPQGGLQEGAKGKEENGY